MPKRFRSNQEAGEPKDLPATGSAPHPGNFPLGSVESRAAARAMIRPGRLRAGDKGTFPCGCWYVVTTKPGGGVLQIVFPASFGSIDKHVHREQTIGA